MIRAMSTAASGMDAQQTKLNVTANNIANVSTSGFKKSRAEFADLMYQTIRAPGTATGEGTVAPTGAQVGMGVRTVATQRQHSMGDLQQTGNALDLAIEGRGFFQVEMPSGENAYTRNGAFKINAEGTMVNADGYKLTSDIVVPPDAQSVAIGADGTVTAIVPGESTPTELGKLQVAMFANPSGLEATGKTLYRETAASGAAVLSSAGSEGAGSLAQGTLEMSNVKVVEEMIDLISGQRAYEINSRVISAADEMLQRTGNL